MRLVNQEPAISNKLFHQWRKMLFFKSIQFLGHKRRLQIHVIINFNIVSHFKCIILRITGCFKLRHKIAQINLRTSSLITT